MSRQKIVQRYCILLAMVLISALTILSSVGCPNPRRTIKKDTYEQNEAPVYCKPPRDYKCGLPELLNDRRPVPLNENTLLRSRPSFKKNIEIDEENNVNKVSL